MAAPGALRHEAALPWERSSQEELQGVDMGEGMPPLTGGLQPEGREPVGLLPGRGRAAAADIQGLLADFEGRLGAQPGGLPEDGAFRMARYIYQQNGLSELLARDPVHESARELFYFLCGVCWRLLLATENLPRRVGILFVVYLLYHSQHPQRFDVPVDVVVLETLAGLREECERRRVLLECPEVLHRLCARGALSVGVRATCRELFFKANGCLGERSEAPVPPRAPRGARAEVAALGGGRGKVQAERLRFVAQDAEDDADLASQRSLSPATSARADLNLGHVLQDGQSMYESLVAGPNATEMQVQGMGKGLIRYRHDTPPELLELPGDDELESEPGRVRKQRRHVRRTRELLDVQSPVDSEGESGLELNQQDRASGRARRLGATEAIRRRAQRERLAEPIANPLRAAGQGATAESGGSDAPLSSSSVPLRDEVFHASHDVETSEAIVELGGREHGANLEEQGEPQREADETVEQDEASSESSAGLRPHLDTEWEAMSGSSGVDEESEADD